MGIGLRATVPRKMFQAGEHPSALLLFNPNGGTFCHSLWIVGKTTFHSPNYRAFGIYIYIHAGSKIEIDAQPIEPLSSESGTMTHTVVALGGSGGGGRKRGKTIAGFQSVHHTSFLVNGNKKSFSAKTLQRGTQLAKLLWSRDVAWT